MTNISVTVNGSPYQNEIEPRLLLVQYLREVLQLTGTHVGCDTSQCGACTVLVDGMALKSCTMFAVQADGAELLTIEGLAPAGGLHPLQEAFREAHGLQCGFCTPGMVMAAYELLQHNAAPAPDEIREALAGNLCRCTGYHNIIRAVGDAARRMADAGPAVNAADPASAVGGTAPRATANRGA